MSEQKTHNDHNEFLLCFDDEGNVIAPRQRGRVHENPCCIWHAIANIWVLNSKGKILVTKRAPHVSSNPGKWQTYVGGHVKANSTFFETATREFFEEIGFKIDKNDLKLVEKGRRKDTMHIYESYAVLYNEDASKLNFSDGEISEAKWLYFEKYQKLRTENQDDWCNGMSSEQYRKACDVLGLEV